MLDLCPHLEGLAAYKGTAYKISLVVVAEGKELENLKVLKIIYN